MNILSLSCENVNYLNILFFVKKILSIVCIVSGVALIFVVIIKYIKLIINDEIDNLKKENYKLIGKLFGLAGIIFLPTIINALMNFFDFADYQVCWTKATKENIQLLMDQEQKEKENETESTTKSSDNTTENKNFYVPKNTNNYWWPVGSSETIYDKDGNLYAPYTPVSTEISSDGYFGDRTYSTGTEEHYGVDILAPMTNGVREWGKYYIVAVKKGVVIRMEPDGATCESQLHNESDCGGPSGKTYGNWIVIKHDDGMYSVYAHIDQNGFKVNVGDEVNQGQVIALMGSSGRSWETHVHFEIRTSQYYTGFQDPLNYIDSNKTRE